VAIIITNKQGNLVKPRRPSIYGYALGKRNGTWCKKCADKYWLYKAYIKSEGTPDTWFFITKDKLHLNFKCSFCSIAIKDFPRFKFYKRWNWYNRVNYIKKDFMRYLYIGRVIWLLCVVIV